MESAAIQDLINKKDIKNLKKVYADVIEKRFQSYNSDSNIYDSTISPFFELLRANSANLEVCKLYAELSKAFIDAYEPKKSSKAETALNVSAVAIEAISAVAALAGGVGGGGSGAGVGGLPSVEFEKMAYKTFIKNVKKEFPAFVEQLEAIHGGGQPLEMKNTVAVETPEQQQAQLSQSQALLAKLRSADDRYNEAHSVKKLLKPLKMFTKLSILQEFIDRPQKVVDAHKKLQTAKNEFLAAEMNVLIRQKNTSQPESKKSQDPDSILQAQKELMNKQQALDDAIMTYNATVQSHGVEPLMRDLEEKFAERAKDYFSKETPDRDQQIKKFILKIMSEPSKHTFYREIAFILKEKNPELYKDLERPLAIHTSHQSTRKLSDSK